jgi:cbb3-type cytochrome oxidase maturation protein
MLILWVMVPVTLAIAGWFLAAFVRSAGAGQFDDLETPAHRILLTDPSDRTDRDEIRISKNKTAESAAKTKFSSEREKTA